jgi:hypothetical protein
LILFAQRSVIQREAKENFDVAGHVFYMDRRPDYQPLVESRPWWRGMDHYTERQKKQVFFATGGCWIARTDFLRQHNFPDRGMVKHYDDVLLGDLVYQTGGRLVDFPESLKRLCKISDGKRRGTGESPQDGVVAGSANTSEM